MRPLLQLSHRKTSSPRQANRQALSLHGSTIISLPLGPGWNEFGPAVVRVRTAKSAVAGDHLLHAHFVCWQTAIVMKGMARISARAPRHLSGLADAKVEQHCHRYGHDDDYGGRALRRFRNCFSCLLAERGARLNLPIRMHKGSGTRSSHSARSVSAQIRTGRSPIHGATAQSVLAIQNARLFREIEDKSRQLELAR